MSINCINNRGVYHPDQLINIRNIYDSVQELLSPTRDIEGLDEELARAVLHFYESGIHTADEIAKSISKESSLFFKSAL